MSKQSGKFFQMFVAYSEYLKFMLRAFGVKIHWAKFKFPYFLSSFIDTWCCVVMQLRKYRSSPLAPSNLYPEKFDPLNFDPRKFDPMNFNTFEFWPNEFWTPWILDFVNSWLHEFWPHEIGPHQFWTNNFFQCSFE